MIDVKAIKEARINAKNRGVKFRYIIDITKDNIFYCKQIIKEFNAELRHLNGVKGNFEINDGGKEYVATASLQKAKPLKQIIHSNVKEIGEQQQYVFDTLWNKAISSEEKMKEIEEGIIPEVTEIIHNHEEAQSLEWHLLDATKEEIQIIYSTVKAYKLQESLGVMAYLSKLSNRGIKVSLLTPKDSSIEKSLQNLKHTTTININYIETETGIKNKYLITDKKNSLVIELKDKDDDIDNYYHYLRQKEDENYTPITSSPATSTILGTAIYSNSKSTVLSYLSIFETLWKQTELLEELKQADILKTEFINVAAHELRTPTQSIIGYCEMLEAFPEKKEDFLNPIKRNAERLYKLTQDILDVAKIESNSLNLNIEKVELNEIVEESIREFFSKPSNIKKDVKVNFNANIHHQSNNKIFAFADKNRIQQVIFNLLDNASKFTEKGEINLSIEKYNDNNNNYAKIRIQDTGAGIDSEILPRLFEKFATKSERGTGLGLYISKNIVEAHGGKIWMENNNNNNNNNNNIDNPNDSKGTVFVFTLPLTNYHH
ncbi:MAG: putative signal transduction histidine kinase, with phosphoacceptor and binding domain [Nitrososphaeraceae archaeon]|nr:putative signal transduction histidine kinase, with phosphoacceptor and binding domain [Nitrososphaeraceae archaeon]